MKKLLLTLFTVVFLTSSSLWAQNVKISGKTAGVSATLEAQALQKFLNLSTAKTAGVTCKDTVDFTWYKSPGLLSSGGTGGYYILPVGLYPMGQFFSRDSMTILGVRALLTTSELGLPSSMVPGGSGVYTHGDTLKLTAALYTFDTTGGINLGTPLATTDLNYIIDTSLQNGNVVILGTWGYGMFANPVDISSSTDPFFLITLTSQGGHNDSLNIFTNKTVSGGDPPYERTSIVKIGSNWHILGDVNPSQGGIKRDIILSPIVQHNLYTSFTTAKDTFFEGDTVRPMNKSHIAFRSEQYNLSIFAEKYKTSLPMSANFAALNMFRPKWVWEAGDSSYAYPDTAYKIYTTPGTNDTVTKTIQLLNRIFTYSLGSGTCPLSTPQTGSKSVVIIDTSTTVGINPITGEEFVVKAYPVPASDFLNVEMQNLDNASLSIFNLAGQRVRFREKVRGKIRINTQDLENGVYILYIEAEGVTSQMKIQIKH